MEPPEREELFTITYGPEPSPRRWSTREKTLLLVIIFALLCFVVELGKPQFHRGPDRATLATKDRMDTLADSLQSYGGNVGSYPASLADLCRLPPGMTQDAWRGPYLESTDKLKDGWGQPFRYKAPGLKNRGRYDLWSAGPDGVDGTPDDVKNW